MTLRTLAAARAAPRYKFADFNDGFSWAFNKNMGHSIRTWGISNQ
jgi:hypothetical protein